MDILRIIKRNVSSIKLLTSQKPGRLFFIILSSGLLFGTAFTSSALAKVKENLDHAHPMPLQGVVQQGTDTLHDVFKRISDDAQILCSSQDQLNERSFVSAHEQAWPSRGADSFSDLDGVVWSDNYSKCTLGPTASGNPVIGQQLKSEIDNHKEDITVFTTVSGAQLTGDLVSLFDGCKNLVTAEFHQLTLSNVASMNTMFSGCTSLTSLDLSSFDTRSVTEMVAMFGGCMNLASLDISSFDTENVIDMSCMFQNCSNLTSLNLSTFETKNVIDMSCMFQNCSNLTSLDLAKFNTSSVVNMNHMFGGCRSLASLDLSKFNTGSVGDMSFMFSNCEKLTSLKLSNFDTADVTNMSSMFANCFLLNPLDVSMFDVGNVGHMSYMFSNCKELTSLDLSNFSSAEAKDMDFMFSNCEKLTSLKLSNFDTKNVEDMTSMFEGCSALPSLDLSAFNTSSLAASSLMFQGCSHLVSLNFSGFTSPKLQVCTGMFANCDSLEDLNLGKFIVPNDENSLAMFADIDMKTIDISGSIPNIKRITMDGACILEPGAGDTGDTASGTFFDYKEPESWSAFYQGNISNDSLHTSNQSLFSTEPDAILIGFDEFKAYQESHPGLTTYVFNGAPTPPGPTPGPTPVPEPEPIAEENALPETGGNDLNGMLFVAYITLAGLVFNAARFFSKRSQG